MKLLNVLIKLYERKAPLNFYDCVEVPVAKHFMLCKMLDLMIWIFHLKGTLLSLIVNNFTIDLNRFENL